MLSAISLIVFTGLPDVFKIEKTSSTFIKERLEKRLRSGYDSKSNKAAPAAVVQSFHDGETLVPYDRRENLALQNVP